MNTKISFNERILTGNSTTRPSSYCKVAFNFDLENKLRDIYNRSRLGLKIFKTPLKNKLPENYGWGKVALGETTRIQNLFAWHSIAPRVYDIVNVNGYAAQVIEFKYGLPFPQKEKLMKLTKTYGVKHRKNGIDMGDRNWRATRFVDFSGLYFEDANLSLAKLRTEAHTRRGKLIGVAYQAVDELGIKGTRNMSDRLESLDLANVDFKDKTVLDVGCNLGAFSRYAYDRGAKRVVAIDRIARLAHEVSVWSGYWNIDFIQARLPADVELIKEQTGIETFDIVLCLAAIKHIGSFSDWLVDLCKDIFIFEGHGGIGKAEYQPQLEQYFPTVKYIGQTSDNYSRAAFRARRQ